MNKCLNVCEVPDIFMSLRIDVDISNEHIRFLASGQQYKISFIGRIQLKCD